MSRVHLASGFLGPFCILTLEDPSFARVSLANYRSRDTGSRADLAAALDKFQQSSLFFGAAFPSRPSDPAVVHQKLVTHATGEDCLGQSNGGSAFRRDLLWTEARDVWHCAVDSVWAEFHLPGLHRPLPLLDAAPLQACIPSSETATSKC